jgi:hypothetical protein
VSAQFSGAKRRPTRQKNGPANPEKNPRELWVGLARRADLRIFVKKTAPPVFVIPAVLGSHPQSFRTFPNKPKCENTLDLPFAQKTLWVGRKY